MEEPTNKINDALKWHFFNLYCMALSDNEFDFTERQALYQIGIKHGIAPEQINEFVLTANLKPVVPEAMNGKVECLYELTQMAWADGQITPEENQTIKKCVIRIWKRQKNVMPSLRISYRTWDGRKDIQCTDISLLQRTI